MILVVKICMHFLELNLVLKCIAFLLLLLSMKLIVFVFTALAPYLPVTNFEDLIVCVEEMSAVPKIYINSIYLAFEMLLYTRCMYS